MATRIQQIRKSAGVSQTAAAALAGVSPNTWKLYEAAPDAVSSATRPGCDAAAAQLAKLAGERGAR